ncbi:hypothetical protein DPM19_10875 [Actinomadura craniellae]|uniref:Uncharacterized protein n=1 Tax=Actinomadura craniellae TaxID=2231787 RepID=A0A365H7W6_9ACTN|nr:hypothetical protein [Actinomadura craniellae]RAY15214.1 hypothetical protein DPM19_10875 [Actinomadura craniellae]
MSEVTSEEAALIKRRKIAIQTEFPDWRISRETSGRWSATQPGWGALYGQSASELLRRLRNYTGAGDVR